jgi:ABC-type Fe2+-enterobactin transport system substrate-binding protein
MRSAVSAHAVLDFVARMLRDACGQQVGQQTGHNRQAQKTIEPFETIFKQSSVYIVEQIVTVLNRISKSLSRN